MSVLVVVSPHYDDAVLSCGQLIEGHHTPIILTVFTGAPKEEVSTEYDKHCGFESSSDALPARRTENERACRILGAAPIDLGLIDNQYGGSPQEEVEDTLLQSLRERYRGSGGEIEVVAPLATRHPDHQKVMNAAVDVCTKAGWPLWLYEELPHRVLWPEEVAQSAVRLSQEKNRNLMLQFIGDGPIEMKRAAVACYRSQLWALNQDCIFVPERFHRVI